jgi:short subunit dehydrogenase
VVSLDGTRAVVTGATSGLGRAMAVALAGAGARVAVTGRRRGRAEAIASELGPAAVGVELDVRREESVAACLDEVYERFGGIDVVVNNAGIGMRTVNPAFLSHPQPFWAVSPSGFRDVIETKVTGAFLVNILLPGGATATGMIPDDVPARTRATLLDPSIMGPPIVWLASDDATGVHDQGIVATEFKEWLAQRTASAKRSNGGSPPEQPRRQRGSDSVRY